MELMAMAGTVALPLQVGGVAELYCVIVLALWRKLHAGKMTVVGGACSRGGASVASAAVVAQ